MDLVEVREDQIGVIERIGALRMPRQLRDLPGAQIGENSLRQLLTLLLQTGNFFLDG